MAIRLNKGTPMLQLPVVPLVDTVINLLIFFLVATKVAEAERELEVMLPDASEAQPITSRPREMIINIDAQGHYFITSKLVGLAQLDQILKAASVNNPGRASAVLRADKRCRWEYVVAAMNSCKKAKIRDYRVTTRDPREGAG
ncbi:MAG: biopolymer transporter ExbD [Thermoguttaceae bacterium]|jgi:biopolymer transport protein ExbD